MQLTDDRLKIAVFIDFDNVEIGVKTTIGGQFDIGLVLEAIKERGEIVTKIAYSDWKRVGDYSRLLTQHAIRMVQRNMTPGGDKNGADITMALDALEMAFTHDHINAFVIVGGDSDFISLVEKLKQYDRKVFVVGGRQFTSATMQKNCHEFIAYENLVGSSRSHRQSGRGGAKPQAASGGVEKVLPLVRRALKVLSEREVTPQLGLLKSTLLQLDSTFSEREYGAGSFRDFMEKVAQAGAVTLKHAGRSLLVEAVDDGGEIGDVLPTTLAVEPLVSGEGTEVGVPVAAAPSAEGVEADLAPMVATMTNVEGVQALEQALATGNPRWPMYIRQMKQFLRNNIENFDERRYGFTSPVELLRQAQKEGIVRLERDRQGVMRVFAGSGQRQPVAGEAVLDAEVSGLPVDGDQSGSGWSQTTSMTEVEVTELSMDDEPLDRQPMLEVVSDEPIVELADGEEPPDSQKHFLAAIEESLKEKASPSPRSRKGSPRGRSTKTTGRVPAATTARSAAVAKQRVRRPAVRKKAGS